MRSITRALSSKGSCFLLYVLKPMFQCFQIPSTPNALRPLTPLLCSPSSVSQQRTPSVSLITLPSPHLYLPRHCLPGTLSVCRSRPSASFSTSPNLRFTCCEDDDTCVDHVFMPRAESSTVLTTSPATTPTLDSRDY